MLEVSEHSYQFAGSWLKEISTDLQSIAGVQQVDIEERAAGELTVNIAVHQPDKQLRYRIYDRELSIMDAFPHLMFDFRLIEAA